MDLLRSERILDKLKLLHYDRKFLPKYKSLGIRALSRHHFAVDKVKSSTSQFYTFACISTWLLKISNRPIDDPDETEDPLDILDNIVAESKSLGIKNLDFPVANLRTGFGEHCLYLLESITEEALKCRKFDWVNTNYPDEDLDEADTSNSKIKRSHTHNQHQHEHQDDETADTTPNSDDDGIDDMVASKNNKKAARKEFLMLGNEDYFAQSNSETESDYEDNNAISLENMLNQQSLGAAKNTKKSSSSKIGQKSSTSRNLRTSTFGAANSLSSGVAVDSEAHLEWLDEVERVAPNLKVVARLESKDWRARLDQVSLHQKTVDEALDSTKPRLDRLEKELGKSLDTVSSRQKYLNSNLESLLQQLRTAQDGLVAKEQDYEKVSGGLTSKSEEFNLLTSRLENVRKSMEEKGTSMTDGAPLVKLKQSLNRLHSEIADMTLQNAVLENQLTQMRMHKKSTLARDVSMNQNTVMV